MSPSFLRTWYQLLGTSRAITLSLSWKIVSVSPGFVNERILSA